MADVLSSLKVLVQRTSCPYITPPRANRRCSLAFIVFATVVVLDPRSLFVTNVLPSDYEGLDPRRPVLRGIRYQRVTPLVLCLHRIQVI